MYHLFVAPWMTFYTYIDSIEKKIIFERVSFVWSHRWTKKPAKISDKGDLLMLIYLLTTIGGEIQKDHFVNS